jgi:RNA polymerase sigma-70 factor, ECF subfamily
MRPVPTHSLVYEQDVRSTEVAAARRERALTDLATATAPRGYRIAFDLLRDRAEAEDAVQEALARACEAEGRLRDADALEGWFFRVLTNVCLRVLRRRRVRRWLGGGRRSVHKDMAPADEPADEVASLGDEAEPRADQALAERQEIAHLLDQLDALPAQQRVALVLRYGHDRSIAEIADMLDVKPATVKTHLVRGLRHLRAVMERLS